MTVFTAITAALLAKMRAFVAEVKKLVADAKAIEVIIVHDAEKDVRRILTAAKAEEKNIITHAKGEINFLKNELIAKISKL